MNKQYLSAEETLKGIADLENAYTDGFNDAIAKVLSSLEDESKVLYAPHPKGFKVIYKETLIKVIKELKQKSNEIDN
jgi:hypothetical protein